MVTTRLFLTGITTRGRHGANPGEKDEPQDFVVDLDVEVEVDGDALASTADYRSVIRTARDVVERGSFELLESLAHAVANAVLEHDGVVRVERDGPQARRRALERRGGRRRRCHRRAFALSRWPRRRTSRSAPTSAIGSNTCGRRSRLLSGADGVEVVRSSRVYETEPVGPPQPAYLNAVLEVRTDLEPAELLAVTRAVEESLGRVRGERWGPRTIDVDILTFDERDDRRTGSRRAAPADARARIRPRPARRARPRPDAPRRPAARDAPAAARRGPRRPAVRAAAGGRRVSSICFRCDWQGKPSVRAPGACPSCGAPLYRVEAPRRHLDSVGLRPRSPNPTPSRGRRNDRAGGVRRLRWGRSPWSRCSSSWSLPRSRRCPARTHDSACRPGVGAKGWTASSSTCPRRPQVRDPRCGCSICPPGKPGRARSSPRRPSSSWMPRESAEDGWVSSGELRTARCAPRSSKGPRAAPGPADSRAATSSHGARVGGAS